MHIIMHTRNTALTQNGFSPLFSVAPLKGALPALFSFIKACSRPAVQREAGRLRGMSKGTLSFTEDIISQVLLQQHPQPWLCLMPRSMTTVLSYNLLSIYSLNTGRGVEKRKERQFFIWNRINRDVRGIKDGEVLPKAKEHLTLPLKTSPSMLSKVNKLRKTSFFPRVF